jgi:methionyl-tRNA formyltransferase
MKVVFMGTPGFACPPLETLAKSSHELLAVVTAPDKPSGRGQKLSACEVKMMALSLRAPVFQPDNLRDPAFLQDMAALSADIFVVIAFRILPEKLYSIPPYGAINIHASLLPKFRGAAPIHHALLNGESETGLTSFFLVKKVDQGDMIAQVSTPIDPNENCTTLSARLSAMAGPFLLQTLDLITQPKFVPQKQDPAQATPAPKIASEDGLIDWRQNDRQVHNRIRAFSERPGAYSFFDGQTVKVLASLREVPAPLPPLAPGELHVFGRRLVVGTGGAPVEIIRLQPEGKKAMDAPSFINGYRIATGQKLASVRKEVRQ